MHLLVSVEAKFTFVQMEFSVYLVLVESSFILDEYERRA